MSALHSIAISAEHLAVVERAVHSALEYEVLVPGGRKLGITGEVGEILICNALNLRLVTDPRAKGIDAIDADGNLVQIKSRRAEKGDMPSDFGRTGIFSRHPFGYALLGILGRDFTLREIWKATFEAVAPILEIQTRRDLHIGKFKKVGECIFPETLTRRIL